MEFRKIEEFEKLKKLFLDKDINKTDTKSYIGKQLQLK